MPGAIASSQRPFIMRKGISLMSDLRDGLVAGMPGVGNVYHVAQTTNTAVYNHIMQFDRTYEDGSQLVHTTIASALSATVECRNDYVIVWPDDSDYDLTAALVLDKKSVHLIAPSGMGYDRGATNAVRIEQTTAATAVMAISDASIEVAGFYLKPYIGCSHITLAATSYAPNIHHNTFVLKWTTSNAAAILCSGDAGAWGSVAESNWFISQAGDDQTCGVIVDVPAPATGARVCNNDFFIGDGNTATIAIRNLATKGTTKGNDFMVAAGDGTITTCVVQGAWGNAFGNRGAVGADALIDGGTDDISAVQNYNSLAGGTIADDLD